MPAHLSVASHLNPDLIDSTESNILPGEMLSIAKPQDKAETPLDGVESTPESNPVTKQPVKSTFAMRDSEDHDEGEGKSSISKKSVKSESWRNEEKDAKKDKKDKKEKEGKQKKKRGPTVCEVTKVSAVPKKDALKLCKVVIHPGTDPVEIVTSAPNVSAGHKFIAAPPGYTTANGVEVKAARVGGLESAGMFCGPKEMGWDTDILDGDLAIMLADSSEVGSPAPSYEEAVAAFQQREEAKQKKEEEAKTAAATAKDEKKNKKKGKAVEDEDLDALLAEFKEDDADDEFDAAVEECKLVAADAAQPEGQEDKAEDETINAKTLANRKKKEKRKAKQQEKTGGEGIQATAAEEEQAESKQPASSSSKDEAPAAAAKKGAKKESAYVKAARERLEHEQKLAEEKRAFEEAERCRVEEEQRQIDEEERKKEEERERKRERKAARTAKQKAEGTYLTKKQREQAKRAAQYREQLGYSVATDGDKEAEETEKPQMIPLATKKKKKRPQRAQETEETGEKETEKPEVEKQAPVEEPEEESDDDDWEKKLEAEAEEESRKVAEAETAAESEEDKDSSHSSDSDSSTSSRTPLRAPVITVMGHPDAGKTKTQDKMRGTNVQEGEAGGITQQLGATFLPDTALEEQTKKVDEDFDLEVPGLLIMDTPGHADFDNLRRRGSSLADLAIVVVDIMKGLEPQTVESLNLLKERRCPFIIALNKIDSLYNWNCKTDTGIQEALGRQESNVRDQFTKCVKAVVLQLNEQGLNCNLYWEHKTLSDFKTCVSLVPMSALTGEGIPDLLYLTLKLTQNFMSDKLEVKEELECTVMEVKTVEGLGTAIDVLLLNGTLKNGDTIVLAGSSGPIVTTIRALLTPQPMKDIRVKNQYVHHKQINTSMSVKISAPGLEDAMPGTQLLVRGPDDDLEELKEEVGRGIECILNGFEKEAAGIYVKASTLGSLEALLEFLQQEKIKIPVFDVGIGEVRKKDVTKACIMKEKHPEYAMILAFDVKVNQEAQKEADTDGVTIFSSDIIFHLRDKITTHMEKFREAQKAESRKAVVFPAELQIDKQNIFRKQDPILLRCEVLRGQLRVGTPICAPDKDNLLIGYVASIQNNNGKLVTVARQGDIVCVKIEQNEAQKHIMYGRHFDHTNKLCSKITRQSIDALKQHFRDEMREDDWQLVVKLKNVFKIKSKCGRV